MPIAILCWRQILLVYSLHLPFPKVLEHASSLFPYFNAPFRHVRPLLRGGHKQRTTLVAAKRPDPLKHFLAGESVPVHDPRYIPLLDHCRVGHERVSRKLRCTEKTVFLLAAIVLDWQDVEAH